MEPFVYNCEIKLGSNSVVWNTQFGMDSYFLLVTREDVITNNKNAIFSFIKSLAKTENFILNNRLETNEILHFSFNYTYEYINYISNFEHFTVILPQSLILALEDQAQWNIYYNLTIFNYIPNFLNFIFPDALLACKKSAVSLIGIEGN